MFKEMVLDQMKSDIKKISIELKEEKIFLKKVQRGEEPGYEGPLMYALQCKSGKARHLLLAYGYLRGVPYNVMEQSTRKDNKPSFWDINSVIKSYDEDAKPCWEKARDWIAA